jgi:hypothetical protein
MQQGRLAGQGRTVAGARITAQPRSGKHTMTGDQDGNGVSLAGLAHGSRRAAQGARQLPVAAGLAVGDLRQGGPDALLKGVP